MPRDLTVRPPGSTAAGPVGRDRLFRSAPRTASQERLGLWRQTDTTKAPALLVGAACVSAAWAAFLQTPTATALQLIMSALVMVISSTIVGRRAAIRDSEHSVWSRFAHALALGGTGIAVSATTLTMFGTGAVWAVLTASFTAGAAAQVYGALIRWNRYSTALSDPYDVINGASSVLVGLALLGVLDHHFPITVPGTSWWQFAVLGLPGVALLICAGTAATLPSLAGLGRDRRLWAVGCALAAALTAVARWAHLGGRLDAVALACGALAASLVATAALLPRPQTPPRESDPVSSTTGALIILLAGAAVLILPVVGPVPPFALLAAGGAVVGAGVRLGSNVRDLGHLAVTRRQAMSDDLTGLANRRALLRHLELKLSRQSQFVLSLLNLDGFKEVNDGLGHSAGDDLIRMVSGRLRTWMPEPVMLARIGGDEFALVIDVSPRGTAEQQAAAAGQRILDALAEPFLLLGTKLHVSTSAGVVLSTGGALGPTLEDAVPAAELLRRADAAMYEAKRARSGATVYNQLIHERTAGALALVEDLRAALTGSGLLLHYQPQVSVLTGVVSGVEGLIRWHHPTRGLLTPGDFLDCAESHGLMGALSDVVLEAAVSDLMRLRQKGHELRMSVNLSASSLLDAGLPSRVASMLLHHGAPPSAVALEITESELITDSERTLVILQELADLGVGLSIDDYGTGYSSLAYLQALPVDELKLDRAFTATLLDNPRTKAVVTSTVDLAHALGLHVVAEGVEDADTLMELSASGCDTTQGFLHSPPLPMHHLLDWLSHHTSAETSAVKAPTLTGPTGGTP